MNASFTFICRQCNTAITRVFLPATATTRQRLLDGLVKNLRAVEEGA